MSKCSRALGLLAVLSLLSLSSCTSLLAGVQSPAVRTVTLSDPPERVYATALRTAIALGTVLTQTDAPHGLLQGHLHGSALLTVAIAPGSGGTTMTVRASLLPNKVALGRLTEADEFLQAYRAQERP